MEHERFDQQDDERTAVVGAGMVLPADHNLADGPTLGWDKGDFGPEDYVGDEETQDYPEVVDGSQAGDGDAVE